MKNEIVLYQSNELAEHIEVKLEDETVWPTHAQMAILFNQTKQNISLHINNCFKEKELMSDSVVKHSLTTAKDGKKYSTKYYNLDVIISVGYRVKSRQGTQFRIWATRAVRHKTWVENKVQGFVSSRTGRNMSSTESFSPYPIPYGIIAKIISVNFKQLLL